METPQSAFVKRLNERTGHLAEQFPPSEILRPEKRNKLDEEISRLVGHTRLKFMPVGKGGVFLKLETDNPSETHYDRVYPFLIRSLERRGIIIPGKTKRLLDGSSGSCPPSLNWAAKAYGYEPVDILPQGLPPGRINAAEETSDHVIISPYPNYLVGMVQTIRELMQETLMQAQLLSKEAVFLDHSRRRETPRAFEAIGREVIDQLPPDVTLDTFVPAIGNGTTIEGITGALRTKFPDIRIHGFEEELGGLFGATGAKDVHMPFVKRALFDSITTVRREEYDEAIEAFNIGKQEPDTLGATSIVAMEIARKKIEEGEALYALTIGYDNLGRYNTVVENPNSIYQGNWCWS
jgi:cysteine synthase A